MTREAKQYSPNEADEILRLSGSSASEESRLTHTDLVRAAAEMDIPEEAVRIAEQLLRERQSDEADWKEFRRKELRFLRGQSVSYLVMVLVFALFMGVQHARYQVVGYAMNIILPILGLLYARSTQTDYKFRRWRAERKFRAISTPEEKIQALLRLQCIDVRRRNRIDLVNFLADEVSLDRDAAIKAVNEFVEKHPEINVSNEGFSSS